MVADFRSKRKQDNIQEDERREIAIKVLVNQDELDVIEDARVGTRFSRAEIVRALALKRKIEHAPIVPEINLILARDLGRSLGNLATLAGVMRSGTFVELEDVRCRVVELQKILRGQIGGL